jgi:glycosyltransferase involved in cell wall biosynthesis
MHILYIHQYFATPNGTIVTRAYEFSRFWTARGHKVTVLTTTAQLTPEDLKDATGKFLKRLNFEGINVFAFNIPYRQKMRKASRCLSWLVFLFVSVLMALLIKNVDVIYARSTPLTTGFAAIAAKRLRKIPFVFEVTDQWPEIPIEMGIIRNNIAIKVLLWLEKTIYQHSDSIIACSPGMADGVKAVLNKQKLQEKPIALIPNFSETSFYRPDVDGSKVRKERGWNDKLVFLHAGTMGTANSLNFIIEVAVKLKQNSDALFVLVGEGNEKPALETRVKELALQNVQISPIVPKRQLPAILAAADVSLAIFGNVPILEHNSANKFFDALAAGKPILLNYSGWQREVLEQNNAGFGCRQYDVDEFVERVLYLDSHREKLVEMGRNARRLAEQEFNRDKLVSQALEVLETTLN